MGEINIKYFSCFLFEVIKMLSMNEVTYEALKAFEATYGIDKKRASLPDDAYFVERESFNQALGKLVKGYLTQEQLESIPEGAFPEDVDAPLKKKRCRITTREFPKDKSDFFFEFGHPPLVHYFDKLVRVGILYQHERLLVVSFVNGYTLSPYEEPPEEFRKQALSDPKMKKLIEDSREAYQKGAELSATNGFKALLEREEDVYKKTLEEKVRGEVAQNRNNDLLTRIFSFLRRN